MPEKKQLVDIGGYKVKITNLDKVLYPNAKIVKAEIIQYYLEISPWMLLFARNRPLSMLRYPDGIFAHQFYSKNAPSWKPDWMITHQLEDDDINYIMIQGAQDLVWLANIASLENHAMNKRLDGRLMMDHIVFDFDPPEQFDYADLRDLTIEIGDFLEEKGFHPYVKTSGSRGAHIYIPIKPTLEYDAVIKEIKLLAIQIAKAFPKRTTNAFRKESRKGKILIDINRNYSAQTTILPFSTRARANAPVSMPLFWKDFKKTKSSQDYTIKTAKSYLDTRGYAWADFHDKAVDVLDKAKIESEKDEKLPKVQAVSENVEKAPKWFDKPAYKPMLAGVTKELLDGDRYVYENKWDGIRVFIYVWENRFKIYSRSGREITKLFPELTIACKFPTKGAVLDGEIIVPDEKGKPIFARVISRMHSKSAVERQMKKNKAIFYCFDIVNKAGKDLCKKTWTDRRKLLAEVLKDLPHYRLSAATQEGKFLFDAAEKMDLEGIMIKDVKGKYLEGNRSDSWLKLKFRSEATCVILGYTDGDGDRTEFFGSLHIAEITELGLEYRGRVGTGFDRKSLKAYRKLFDKLEMGPMFIDGKVEEQSKSSWFAKSLLICKIEYARMTESGTFREPVFKKLEERMYDL